MASGSGPPSSSSWPGAPAAPPRLHVRMCKKIAQLTKVIYALNVKNDEHEDNIQALKEAHQEEIQNILAETRETAFHYKKKVEREQELQQRIQSLEQALQQCRPLKEEAPTKSTTARKQEDTRDPPTESQEDKEGISLPKDMLHMKPDSKNRVQTSKQESDCLPNEQGPFEGEKLNIKGNLKEKGIVEMWTLIRETEALKWENKKLAEEYAEKSRQLQASHERDKETWRKVFQQPLADSYQDWQQSKLEQRENFKAREAALQHQIRKLEADLETKDQSISKLEKLSQKLKETMQEVQVQLEELKKKHKNEIRQLQREKVAMRGKLQDSSQEVSRLENFIRQNQDIAKYSEFLKYLPRKPSERQKESQDASLQLKNVSQWNKGITSGREESAAPASTRRGEKRSERNAAASRSDSGAALQREDEQSLASFPKEALGEEWSHQKAELQAQEPKESMKKDSDESLKVQQEPDQQEVAALEEEARGAWQSEQQMRWQQQQSLLIESLKTELAEQQASCVIHKKENDELQEELRNVMALKKQQEENNRDQIQTLKDEVVKCQSEICGLKKENALLKDTVDLLRADVALQKQTSGQLQESEGQHRRFKELEETPRKREPRPEDLHLISCLREKLSEKEEMIKELMDGGKLQPPFVPSTEPHRNRSFSFNTNPSTYLAPIAKQKKKMDDMPSCIVSVPNLASYAKNFLSGDLRPKKNPPQITKSTSLGQTPGCIRVCCPPVQVLETKADPRLQSNKIANPKDAQKLDSQPQEWFTKYFSF